MLYTTYIHMENQINTGEQTQQQFEQNLINQQPLITDKPKPSIKLIIPAILGIPFVTYILFQLLSYPINLFLIPTLFGDTSNAGLGGIAILSVTTILIAIVFGLICGVAIYLVLKKIRYLFVGFALFMLIFVIHRTLIKISGERYLSSEVNSVLENVDEVVGKEKLTFTYTDSTPIYNGNGTLEAVKFSFKVITPKTGDYLIDSYLGLPRELRESAPVGNPRPDSFDKTTISLTQGVPVDYTVSLEMTSFVQFKYEGELNLNFRVWRTNIQVKDVAWHKEPLTSWPVNIVDSGNSQNIVASVNNGLENPVYLVGPFFISQP